MPNVGRRVRRRIFDGTPSRQGALAGAHQHDQTQRPLRRDGNGLYLIVDEAGAKRWLLRTVVHGRRRDLGLGSLRLVSLAEAREKARHYRKIAREGGRSDRCQTQGRAIRSNFFLSGAARSRRALQGLA